MILLNDIFKYDKIMVIDYLYIKLVSNENKSF